MITETTIKPKTVKLIAQYLESCDPLVMMSLLFELGRTRRESLTNEQWREISGCHELLGVIFRNE